MSLAHAGGNNGAADGKGLGGEIGDTTGSSVNDRVLTTRKGPPRSLIRGPPGLGGEHRGRAAHGTLVAVPDRRMTTSEELGFLHRWGKWPDFLHLLETKKHSYISWQTILSYHCTTACQPQNPKKGEMIAVNLDAGLGTPTVGAAGGWRVTVRLPHMFRSGDNLDTNFESLQDYGSMVEVQQAACKDVVAFFLLTDSSMVKIPGNAFVEGALADIRQCAIELQAAYADLHSTANWKADDGHQLWPTFNYLAQNNAPRQQSLPLRRQAQSLYQPLRRASGETQESRDLQTIQMLQDKLQPDTWHDIPRLPHDIWVSLAELVAPNKLHEFFRRHRQLFEVDVCKVRIMAPMSASPWGLLCPTASAPNCAAWWSPPIILHAPGDWCAAPDNDGSAQWWNGAGEASPAARATSRVGDHPIGTLFAKKTGSTIRYGMIFAHDPDTQSSDILWQTKHGETKLEKVQWTRFCSLCVADPLNNGERLCVVVL